MNQRSKILIGIFLLLVGGAIAWNYDRYLIEQDYLVQDYVSCDPVIEACFISLCEEGDEECDETPYKKLKKNARYIEACTPGEEECPELTCGLNETGCVIETCTEDALEDGERCSNDSDAEVDEEEVTPEDETPSEEP